MLVDGFGREHIDLRISLTDRCSLRCVYCMPAQGLAWTPRAELLTHDEVVAVVRVAAGLGVRSVRLTGGEPLLRKDITSLVRRIAELVPQLSMTTNGLRLAALAGPLADAGLTRVNVSLDTLRPDRFRALTRRDGLPLVLAGLAAAAAAGLAPVKVNAVLVRGVNDDEAPELLAWALGHGYELRVIEQMPLDADASWDRGTMVTAAETLETLGDFDLAPELGRGSAPAERFHVTGPGGLTGRLGVIRSVTQPFCRACDRLRVTSDGQVRNCLFAHDELDLRAALRAPAASTGAVEARVADVLHRAVGAKRSGHGIGEPGFAQPDRPMSAIGG